MAPSSRWAAWFAVAVISLALASSAAAEGCSEALNRSGSAYAGTTTRTVPPAPLAQTAQAWSELVTTILAELAKGAVGAVGANAMGHVLKAIGLSTSTDSQLTHLETRLSQIDARLAVVQEAVNALRSEVAQSSYTNLVTQALPLIASIKDVQAELRALSTYKTATGRKNAARKILLDICSELLRKQTEFNERVAHAGSGADNIITASSKAMKAATHRFWTDHQNHQLQKVFEYFELYEVVLLELRVEWWNAIGEEPTYIAHQIQTVKDQITHQRSLLKPGPGFRRWVDVRHPGLVWWPLTMADSLNRWGGDSAELGRIYAARGYDRDKMGLIPFSWGRIQDNVQSSKGKFYLWPLRYYHFGDWSTHFTEAQADYRPPTADEVLRMFENLSPSPLAALRAAGINWGLGAFRPDTTALHKEVIWTTHSNTSFDLHTGHLRFNEWSGAPWGVIAVRNAPHTYWYS